MRSNFNFSLSHLHDDGWDWIQMHINMLIKETRVAFYFSCFLFRSEPSQSMWTKLNYIASQEHVKMVDMNKLQAHAELIYVIKRLWHRQNLSYCRIVLCKNSVKNCKCAVVTWIDLYLVWSLFSYLPIMSIF